MADFKQILHVGGDDKGIAKFIKNVTVCAWVGQEEGRSFPTLFQPACPGCESR